MAVYSLSIVHISDLHERGPREKERWRRYRVLGPEWTHALDALARDTPIDLVCFTGDLASRGMADEYECALPFLTDVTNHLRVPPERLFLVPGNHDIHRDCDGAEWDRLRRGLLEVDALDLSRWLAGGVPPRGFDNGVRDRILGRAGEYRAWLKDELKRPDLLPSPARHPFLGYRKTIRLAGRPFDVHIVGFDSAWLAGSDNDTGKLLLTDEQVMRLASDDGRRLPGFRLGLIHHPISDLFDADHCTPLLAEHVDLLMRGHLHRERVETVIDPDSTLRHLAAGSLYEGDRADRWPNGFHLATVTLDEQGRPLRYDLRLKAWSPRGWWYDDGGVYKAAKNGRLTVPVTSARARSSLLSLDANDPRYIPPDPVFQRIQLDRFVGRAWLEARVDDFLADHSHKSGALLLIGDAGIGKTTFLAHLVRKRAYPHVFAEQVPGAAGLARATISLATQIAARHQVVVPEFDDVRAVSHDFLDRVLRLAARQLAPGEQLVIVCDSLDEAGVAPGGNAYGLPRLLPDGVYLILSQRPGPTRLNLSPLTTMHLSATSEENLGDVHAYLTEAVERPEIKERLRAAGHSSDSAIQILHERSRGLWIYVHYVVDEISRGRLPLDLARLPSGVAAYYAEYWDDWRDGRRGDGPAAWSMRYAPLLATLAAVDAPLALEQLRRWADVAIDDYEARRLLRERWPAFVTESTDADGTTRYRLYHTSLRDFVTGSVDRSGLSPAHALLLDDLAQWTARAHARIVAAVQIECEGQWGRLAADDYLRTNLVRHVVAAGDADTAFELLVERNDWAAARFQRERSHAATRAELEHAWNAFGAHRWSTGRQVCWLLCATSLSFHNTEPTLIAELTRRGIWTPAMAFEHARFIGDDYVRRTTLLEIAPLLPRLLLRETVQMVMRRTEGYLSDYVRLEYLKQLLPLLDDPLKHEMVDVTDELTSWNGPFFSEIAPHLTARQCDEALRALPSVKDEVRRADALVALWPRLSTEQAGSALTLIEELQDDWVRGIAVGRLALPIPDELKFRVTAVISGLDHPVLTSHAIGTLSPALPRALQLQLLDAARRLDSWPRQRALQTLAQTIPDALSATEREIAAAPLSGDTRRDIVSRLEASGADKDLETQAACLAFLLPLLPPAVRNEVGRLALRQIGASSEEHRPFSTRSLTMSSVARELPDLRHELVALAVRMADAAVRAEALIHLLPHLSGDQRAAAIHQALDAVRAISSEPARRTAFAELAEHLPRELPPETLALVRSIDDRKARAVALGAVIDHAPPGEKESAIAEALHAMGINADERYRGYGARDLAKNLGTASTAAFTELLEVVRTLGEAHRSHVLGGIVEHCGPALTASQLAELLAFVTSKEDAATLGAIVRHVPAELRQQILLFAARLLPSSLRLAAYAQLLPHMPAELGSSASVAALDDADHNGTPDERLAIVAPAAALHPEEARRRTPALLTEAHDPRCLAASLIKLVAAVPDLLPQAMASAASIADPESRAVTFLQLARAVPEALSAEPLRCFLDALSTCPDAWQRAFTLANDAWSLVRTQGQEDHALRVALAIADPSARVYALKGAARSLNGPHASHAASAINEAVTTISSDWERADAYEGLDVLPEDHARVAFDIARSLGDPSARSLALIYVMSIFDPIARTEVAHEALRALGQPGGYRRFGHGWRSLADQLPAPLRDEALSVLLALDETACADALGLMAACWPSEILRRFIPTARSMVSQVNRLKVLCALVGRLPAEDSNELLQEVLAQSDGPEVVHRGWSFVFSELVSRWHEISLFRLRNSGELCTKIITALKGRPRKDVVWWLGAMAPLIHHAGGSEAIRETLRGIATTARWWP